MGVGKSGGQEGVKEKKCLEDFTGGIGYPLSRSMES